jgi:hypothetical protein
VSETGDICERRHGGDAASKLANKRADKVTGRAKVLAFWKRRMQASSAEYEAYSGQAKNIWSGRITWLLKHGYLENTGRLDAAGCRLLRITEKGLKA